MDPTNKILAELERKITPRKSHQINFPNFIYKIRFPVYKNLEPHTELDFRFPLTVLVGPNGSGKSSVLHALQGAPDRRSVGNFWFSTKLDPIREGRGKPNCFIYEYYNTLAKKKVEVIKQRVRYDKIVNGERRKNPDYWEPTRVSKEYGMTAAIKTAKEPEPGGLTTGRWQVPKTNVLYLDFRSELSAFDQYFYFQKKPEGLKLYKSKQDRIRAWVKNRLNPLMKGNCKFKKDRGGKTLNKPLVILPNKELQIISYILGKKYSECKMIEHECFGQKGCSVLFTTEDSTYSEAFAGSGEISVVRLVNTVMNAEENSLILLDEPEVSLHPGAQKRVCKFLLNQCLKRGHQVVLSSHSSVFLENIPNKAIKSFCLTRENKFRILNDVCKSDAFIQIGQTITTKKIILVEDSAAQSLVNYALKLLGEEYTKAFDVVFYPGGETAIFKDLVIDAKRNNEDIYVIFDGDIYVDKWPIVDDVSNSELDNVIEIFTRQNIKKLNFKYDGRSSDDIKNTTKRIFLKYISTRCFFLPGKMIPEELIWNAFTEENKLSFETDSTTIGNIRFKNNIGRFAQMQTGKDTAEYRKVVIDLILTKHFDDHNDGFIILLKVLKKIKALSLSDRGRLDSTS